MINRIAVLLVLVHIPTASLLGGEGGLRRPHSPLRADVRGLHIKARHYPAYQATEWQIRLRAPAKRQSPLYRDLKSADFVIDCSAADLVTLHWSKGSHSSRSDFQPHADPLIQGSPVTFESFGGRSSDGVMPFFNVAGANGGLIVAVGWSGDWRASFARALSGEIHVTAGLKQTRFRLAAGEEVRLPSVLMMNYRGSWIDGQNQFRRLLLHHFTPTNHDPMRLMPVAASCHGEWAFNDTTEKKLIEQVTRIADLNLPLDAYWLDAGWNLGGFPSGQGNPCPDPVRFPRGLAPVGDAVRDAGMRFIVWFEPERVMAGTWLEKEHPDWLLKPSQTPDGLDYMEKDGFFLFDLGNRQARTWAVASLADDLANGSISVYRQDFNLYPAFFWHTGTSPNELGLREVRYITGLYEFLDLLVERNPHLIIDGCASGGRRLDFEMLRRSVVLWRSDSCWGDKDFPRNVQAMTHGLSLWLPLHGLGAAATDAVALRSGMGACGTFPLDFRDQVAVPRLRRHLGRYVKVRSLFLADFYPLTSWTDDSAQWIAFQFNDPAKQEGLVQAFCGKVARERACVVKLRGLEPGRTYCVHDWDSPGNVNRIAGADLLARGLEIRAHSGDYAGVFQYQAEPVR